MQPQQSTLGQSCSDTNIQGRVSERHDVVEEGVEALFLALDRIFFSSARYQLARAT